MANPLSSPALSPARNRLSHILLIAAVVVAPILVLLLVVWKGVNDAKAQHALDAIDTAMAAEVDQYIITTLSNKGPDDPLIKRFGAFQQLTGTGYRRTKPVFDIPEEVTLGRMAVFARGKVPMGIRIYQAGALGMNLSIYPDDKWLADNPLATEIAPNAAWYAAHPEYISMAPHAGLLVLLPNNAGASATMIDAAVTHPKFQKR